MGKHSRMELAVIHATMNKLVVIIVLCLTWARVGQGQSGPQALKQYQTFLRSFKTVSYDVQRIDTFPDGSVWDHKGHAILIRDQASKLLNAKFSAFRPDLETAYVFNGNVGFKIDHKAKSFKLDADPYLPSILGGPAGQMIIREFIAPDTGYYSVTSQKISNAVSIILSYPDQPKLDQRDRRVIITLDRKTNRPTSIRNVVRKGEDFWTSTYLVSNVRFDSPKDAEELNDVTFLAKYTALKAPVKPVENVGLAGQSALDFQLTDLDKNPIRLSDLKGKLVLLDFWTTSCTPCITSMPKLQALQDKHRDKGLVVVGIIMDAQAATRAQGILKRQGASYRNLLGDALVEKLYNVDAYPRYVVISPDFKVVYDDTGYSTRLEELISQQLQAK